MARVFVQSYGNGYTWVDNEAPTDGEPITIHCEPYLPSELIEVQAWTSFDESIALDPTSMEQTIIYNPAWRNVYVEAYYTGSEPTPDPPLKVPIWLLAKASNNWRKL
jgi:hypothetical protein